MKNVIALLGTTLLCFGCSQEPVQIAEKDLASVQAVLNQAVLNSDSLHTFSIGLEKETFRIYQTDNEVEIKFACGTTFTFKYDENGFVSMTSNQKTVQWKTPDGVFGLREDGVIVWKHVKNRTKAAPEDD